MSVPVTLKDTSITAVGKQQIREQTWSHIHAVLHAIGHIPVPLCEASIRPELLQKNPLKHFQNHCPPAESASLLSSTLHLLKIIVC